MAQEFSPERVEIAESVLHQALQKEVVLLNLSTQHYYGLNEIGSRMWELLIDLHDVSAVADRLETMYNVDGEELRTDLERLVTRLLEAGLLKIC